MIEQVQAPPDKYQVIWTALRQLGELTIGFVGFAANILTIIASVIAISIYLRNRKEISQALKKLLLWSFSQSIQEVNHKIAKLRELDAENQTEQVRNLLFDLVGQLSGMEEFGGEENEMIEKILKYSRGKKLKESEKIMLLSELSEKLKTLTVKAFKGVNDK